MGYGARTGAAEAWHDELYARALYARGASSADGAGAELLLVECDLCLMAASQAAEVRARIAARTGIAASRVMVGCIHTHSAPDTGLGQLIGGQPPPGHVPPLLDAAVEAGVGAFEAAEPARLGVGHASATIGRNRRLADGPLEPDVLVVRVDRADGSPLAVAYVHGCHPTALGHDNLAVSADWPWAAGLAIAEALPGALPIFVLGAHADVDPRTRGLLDLAVAGQSVGVGFDEVEALGREIGEAVARAALAIETDENAVIGCESAELPVAALAEEPGQREAALAALDLPADDEARVGRLFALEHERTRGYPAAERRERIARVRLYLRNRTAHRFVFSREPRVEVQVLQLGSARLLGLPAEPTVNVGLDWKARAGPDAAVVGIANGWLRYLPHARDYADPAAHQKYEVLQASLVPDAAERLLDEAVRVLARLEGSPAG
jgi:hypothetical protein